MNSVLDGSAGTVHDRSDGPLRVLIVDDHEMLRVGTRQVLETSDDIVVVGETGEGSSAISMAEAVHPDVALVDIRLPDRSGIDVTRELALHQRAIRVVILTAYNDEALVRSALEAGAIGYLLKTMPRMDLVEAVRAAGTGTVVLDPAVADRWDRVRRSPNPDIARLTLRERQIVALVGDGLPNKGIAGHLGLSVRTVEGHMNHVFAKLSLETRTELVRFALANGLSTQIEAQSKP